MPVTPPETHPDNEHTAENKIRICHVYAASEAIQPGASDTVLRLDEILSGLRLKKMTLDEANQQLDSLSMTNFQLNETKQSFTEAIIAIKNYKAD
jgi:membrane-bound ClpP family serine protease